MKEDDTCLEELVSQFDSKRTEDEYVNADDGLSTCLSFDDTNQWREELRSMVCDETPSLSKQIRVNENSEDEDEIEPERSSITSYDAALRISNNLQLFKTKNGEEEVAGAMFNVITLLGSAKLNHAKKLKQSSILQYFNKTWFM